ncbi:MAG: tetratricopeptide repeat protein [Gemmatimonadaceae bacterium]
MDYDRLRELQAKFDENPRRYFAPLANEYRKGGNPKRAIEICRAHLAQMPGHMSGQVVFGQSLFEGGEHEEARKVFEGALVLDPENLIALRSLGDLALQAGDTDEARTYYKRLLEADPKDAAVIALVSEIDVSGGASEGQTSSEFTVDFSFVDQPPVASPTEVSPPAAETVSETESSADQAGAVRSEPETANVQGEAPLGLEHHYPTGDDVPTVAEPMGPNRDALVDWSPPASPLASTDEVPFGDPPAAADASSMFGDSSGFGVSMPTPTAASKPVEDETPPPAAPPPSTYSFAGTNPEPFVNETMAQLYLQQGYKQLALRVYRQLSERKPTEQSFRDRIAEIEASQAAETNQAEPEAKRQDPPSIESPTPEPAAPRSPSTESPLPPGPGSQPSSVESPGSDRSPVDSPPSSFPSSDPDSIESPVREGPRAEPEGIAARQPSMREFFATLGRRRPPRPAPAAASRWTETPAPPPSAAAPETPQGPSLDAVFAGAKVSATDARAASTLAGAFSVSARGTSPPSPAANPTPRANPRLQAQESEEDVAKFRAWLDGLTGE